MKKFRLILLGLVATGLMVSVNSCDEADLTQESQVNLSPDTYFKNGIQVENAVNSIYANLQTQALYQRHMFFMMDNMSHENMIAIHLEADKKEYYNFSFGSSHGAIGGYYDACYRGISKANFVIENEAKIQAIDPFIFGQTGKDNALGQAKFLRALYYFFLVTRFGDVPLVTTIPTSLDGFPRSPASEIYQLIIDDLTDAQNLLPEKGSPDTENGRANRGAAIALLGKVYLFMDNKTAAINEFNKIYGNYTLEAEYFDNFTEEGEHGPESIFEVEFDDDLGTSALWQSLSSGVGPDDITFRGQEYGCLNWFNVYPSQELIDEYEPGDTRDDDSFYYPGDTYAAGVITAENLVVDGVQAPAGWRKYQNYYKDASEDNESGINAKVIRYADVLLMMAECVYETDPGLAMDYINEVRSRPSVMLPDVVGLSGPALFDAIVHERMVELCGEQTRFPDLVRWGLADDYLAGTGFVPGKHELFPIPNAEISTNNSIGPEDQNPGY